MELKLLKENEDGSADFTFELTSEEKDSLIRYGIMQAIRNAIEKSDKYDPFKLDTN